MTKHDILIMMFLDGRFVYTHDARGGGTIVGITDGEVTVRSEKFRYKVPVNEAWFIPSKPEVTVAVALEMIDQLAAVLGE